MSHHGIANHPPAAHAQEARRGPSTGPAAPVTTASRLRPLWLVPLLLVAVFLLLVVTAAPLNLMEQAVFAVITLLIAMVIKRWPGRTATLALTCLSLVMSSRYLYWRLAETIDYGAGLDTFFSYGLIAAEIYAWLVLVLGYFQTIWPLGRKPVAMPADLDLWPTIDVLIPTYNEPLKVVKPTVLAALALDWPREKINICILDDGRREEFRVFAEQAGVRWITRPDNQHAKAGNINAALKQTSGELVAIFDCDHIPTRSFLQMTVGWFLKDRKLAMLQTPHHFFSPDPFERNLGTHRRVPNEGELFYGLVQDGNDLWDAAFFCGSCAVLRRDALLKIGGIAVETVTEDAHTALKLHRAGWTTAYLSLPQAAGLATESLSAHVGQRIRWARGMAQIFRIDNPLVGRGLSLAQRLCYVNAMLHFFYGLPRLIFLTAPLAYLFVQAHVINASALMIAAMALPHLVHANMTNSRVQGRYRHSFWAEVYETVLAWYILRPTTLALLNPKAGSFNVTPKGGLVASRYIDWQIARPYLFLLLLNLAGVVVGGLRLFWWPDPEVETIVLNLVWTAYNIVILGAALAAAAEARQVRGSHRVPLDIPASLRLADGRLLPARTSDVSEGGLRLRLDEAVTLPPDSVVQVELYRRGLASAFDAQLVDVAGGELRLRFGPMSLAQESMLVQCTFARADAWLARSPQRGDDRPFVSMGRVMAHGLRGCAQLLPWRRQGRPAAADGPDA
ncbi:UDP-forming cellulose synthase catalytic subunit [Sphaerotilus mobilis]|uniref:Cellulose synthase catalytic subunit [UDP-forming] n=1 Tax=Sphaerotilus mobilis TaxID=47994 RepID=A0A4Q7LJ16_9BURK|nr:UDP-forming cellulose synthase catalytic subunit [Sphaerotilus mobilis]RZS54565.1 cellulose synthase (UDP-forming) [Sphaerotilus mobilis]